MRRVECITPMCKNFTAFKALELVQESIRAAILPKLQIRALEVLLVVKPNASVKKLETCPASHQSLMYDKVLLNLANSCRGAGLCLIRV